MSLPLIEPMLASTRVDGRPGEWAFEPKLDGWRALVYVDGCVKVRTRRGRDISASVPERVGMADALAGRAAILDGELVADGGRAEDFYRLGTRIAAHKRRSSTTVAFVAFDVLCLDGGPTVDLPYVERRQLLEDLALAGPAWCTVPVFFDGGRDVLGACDRLGLEVVMAKRLDSPYRPGLRSRDWVKVKTAQRSVHGPRRHDH